MLVGNKADLADQREVQEKQAKELADKYGSACFPYAVFDACILFRVRMTGILYQHYTYAVP